MSDHNRILILGGTREAAELARKLAAQGHSVTTSFAGRTKEPVPIEGEVRIGGFSTGTMTGAEGLADFLIKNQYTRLIDATHPFAKQISKNAVEAAKLAGVTFDIHRREPWSAFPGDQWTEVSTVEQAVNAIPSGARVLLAMGSQHILPFSARRDVYYLVRMIEEPDAPLSLANHDLILARPSFDEDVEASMLREHEISHIVCRNSGGEGAYAKIIAARKLEIPVIMIRQTAG